MEIAPTVDGQLGDEGKRSRRAPKEFIGDLKGDDLDLAFDKAMKRLETQSIKRYGYKVEPEDSNSHNATVFGETSNLNQHMSNANLNIVQPDNIVKPESMFPIKSEQCSNLILQHENAEAKQYCPNQSLPQTDYCETAVKGISCEVNAPNTMLVSPPKKVSNNLPVSKSPTGGGMCFCGKTFSRMDTCKSHFIQVHGESFRSKNLPCLVCKQSFAFDLNLSTHMKKEHKISGKLTIVEGCGGLLAKTASGGGICLICTKQYSRMDTCKNHFKSHKLEPVSSSNQGIVNEGNLVDTAKYHFLPDDQDENPTFSNKLIVKSKYDIEQGLNSNHGGIDNSMNLQNCVASQLDYIEDPSNSLQVKMEDPTENEQTLDHTATNDIKEEPQNNPEKKIGKSNKYQRKTSYQNKDKNSKVVLPKHKSLSSSKPRTPSHNIDLRVANTESGGGVCFCGKEFSRMDNCRNHFIQIHGESFRSKDLPCLVCKQAFAFDLNLSTHMKREHKISGKLTIKQGYGGLLAKTASGGGICLICTKQFSRMDNCINHFKSHKLKPVSSSNQGIVNEANLVDTAKYQFLPNEQDENPTFSNKLIIKSSYDPEQGSNHGGIDKSTNLQNCVVSQLDEMEDPSNLLQVKMEEPTKNEQTLDHTATNNIKREPQNNQQKKIGKRNQSQRKTSYQNKDKNSKGVLPKHKSISSIKPRTPSYNIDLRVAKTESGGGLCEICGNVYARYDKVREHYIKKHGEIETVKNHFCMICKDGYAFEQNLREHLKTDHQIAEKVLLVEDFGGNIAKTESGRGICLICGSKYARIDKVREHYRAKHVNIASNDALAECVSAIKGFKQQQT